MEQIRALGDRRTALAETSSPARSSTSRPVNMGMVISQAQLRERRSSRNPCFITKPANFDRAHLRPVLALSATCRRSSTSIALRARHSCANSWGPCGQWRRAGLAIGFVEDFFRYRDERIVLAETITDALRRAAPTMPKRQTRRICRPSWTPDPNGFRHLNCATSRCSSCAPSRPARRGSGQRGRASRRSSMRAGTNSPSPSGAASSKCCSTPRTRRRPSRRPCSTSGRVFSAAAEALDLYAGGSGRADPRRAGRPNGRPGGGRPSNWPRSARRRTPIESPFGWHVLRVAEIQPPYEPVFEDQREVARKQRSPNAMPSTASFRWPIS